MKIQVVFTDLETDGAVPVECEISADYGEVTEFLNLKFDKFKVEISVPLHCIGMVLGNEEHG